MTQVECEQSLPIPTPTWSDPIPVIEEGKLVVGTKHIKDAVPPTAIIYILTAQLLGSDEIIGYLGCAEDGQQRKSSYVHPAIEIDNVLRPGYFGDSDASPKKVELLRMIARGATIRLR